MSTVENLLIDPRNCHSAQEKIQFKKSLNQLYKKIDGRSKLLWDHDNHITIGRKRKFDQQENYFNRETTQIGYGEISPGSMTGLISYLMNLDTILSSDSDAFFDTYSLSQKSYFLDIGSGFGKPIFHCALQAGCVCQGVEVVPARVEFCQDFYFEMEEENIKKRQVERKGSEDIYLREEEDKGRKTKAKKLTSTSKLSRHKIRSKSKVVVKEDKISEDLTKEQSAESISKTMKTIMSFVPYCDNYYKLCSFIRKDATSYKAFTYENIFKAPPTKTRIHFSHIYSYNKLMSETCRTKICRILNRTNWKVLAWYSNEKTTRKNGLLNFKLVKTMQMVSSGNEKFTCYVYIKIRK